MRCTSYCVSQNYAMDDLGLFLRDHSYDPKFFDDVLHIALETGGDVFCFAYGCCVFWNVEEPSEKQFLKIIAPFCKGKIEEIISDSCHYDIGNHEETHVVEEDGTIHLKENDDFIKLSCSHGLSQSVKLSAFERDLTKTIESTRYLPKEFAEKGKTSLSRRKIAQYIGRLFAQRNFINLHTDLLDIPEFFWKRPKYEAYYTMVAEYLDIKLRLDIVNRKLDVIHELYEMLSDELKHRHSSFLELVIVALISLEVLLTLIKGHY